ncbi:PREDICTED: ubiquitin carboxyl-terminal hydrolase 5-like [Prunus mume]|uniref:Ubiquitin carboxyl-terminal hydrolase 5-like n=1 Tax=Prunus mume TaxID=102107 RepID=A0ABM1LYA0_PRUMU|nr:PREDICTED: ubiquitin carboxyl-terminal hydrolase 5-like [Prunus mume]
MRERKRELEGKIALAFGELLRKLWAPGRTPVAPRPFKTKLARFAPQFSGYNQHDSQELLAFLLDGLHEDLNRVKHKPYVKFRDADGRPDEDVADEYWANHIARNDSIIVDVCQVSMSSKNYVKKLLVNETCISYCNYDKLEGSKLNFSFFQ